MPGHEPADDGARARASDPLLPHGDGPVGGSDAEDEADGNNNNNSHHGAAQRESWSAASRRRRRRGREMLSSKKKHYLAMTLVALDVVAILTDVFVALVACDMGQEDEQWVDETRAVLKKVELVFSAMFLVELLLTIWAFGYKFFTSWFHIFDTTVILASFTIDVVAHGVTGEIGSLVIILRLWRFVKLVEEMSVGASERMEDIEGRLGELEKQNSELKERLEVLKKKAGKSKTGTDP